MEFSIIIPTRNRPALLKEAIESVRKQTFKSYEIIVVNDGSEAHHMATYRQIEQDHEQITILHLERSLNGHGPCYAINMGVSQAQGNYLGFLDDDDVWVDPEHLERARLNLVQFNTDVYLTNQSVFKNNKPTSLRLWLATLEEKLVGRNAHNTDGSYHVSVDDLMSVHSFNHMNATLVLKTLYQEIKGMDENIRYEGEREFYFRLIDNARTIIYHPVETARHNVPDNAKSNNVSTMISSLEKMNFRLYLLNKTIFLAKHHQIVAHAIQHKIYTLKFIAELLAEEKKYALAYHYAKEAMTVGFTLKWTFFCLACYLKGWFKN